MDKQKMAAHALFDIVWSNMEDRAVVEVTLEHIRKYVHDRVKFWIRDTDFKPRMEVEEVWHDNLAGIVDKIHNVDNKINGYGRLLTLYALFACRMGVMIIHTQQLLLPRIVAPIPHAPTKATDAAVVVQWAEMANDNGDDGPGERINIKDLPMFERLYPSDNVTRGHISDSMASTFRSLHYESVATLTEHALVELYTRITLLPGARTALGHDLLDILDASSNRDVERRVFRWYRQFVPVTNFFPENTIHTILCNQSGMCNRRDQSTIEGGRTPNARPKVRNAAPTSVTSVPWETMHTIIAQLFSIPADRALVEKIWKIHRMQRPLVICALMHYQMGDTYTNVSQAQEAYQTLLYNAPTHFAVTNGKNQLFEEDVCLSALQLAAGWVEHTMTEKASQTQRLFSFLDRVFMRDTDLPLTGACRPVDKDRSIGISISSVLSNAMGGLVPMELAEKVCNFVSLQAFTRYRPAHCFNHRHNVPLEACATTSRCRRMVQYHQC